MREEYICSSGGALVVVTIFDLWDEIDAQRNDAGREEQEQGTVPWVMRTVILILILILVLLLVLILSLLLVTIFDLWDEIDAQRNDAGREEQEQGTVPWVMRTVVLILILILVLLLVLILSLLLVVNETSLVLLLVLILPLLLVVGETSLSFLEMVSHGAESLSCPHSFHLVGSYSWARAFPCSKDPSHCSCCSRRLCTHTPIDRSFRRFTAKWIQELNPFIPSLILSVGWPLVTMSGLSW